MWSEKGVLRLWRYRGAYSEKNIPFFALLQKISKSFSQFNFGLLQHISGLRMCNISICIVGGCYWDPQIRAKLEKKNWGSILNDIIDYRVHVLLQILTIFHDFWHLFSIFVGFFWWICAYTGLLRAGKGRYHTWVQRLCSHDKIKHNSMKYRLQNEVA